MSVLKKPFDEICSFFNIDPEKSIKCMVLERARGNSEYPIVYFISYFNSSIPFTGGGIFLNHFMEYLKINMISL